MMTRTSRRFASPRARRALRERGLDIAQLHGSGPNGRVIEADVTQFTLPQSAPATEPVPQSAPALAAPAPIEATPQRETVPQREAVRALFWLRAEVDLSALGELQRRHEVSTREWAERAVARAVQKHGGEAELSCLVSFSASRRALEFVPALPATAQGVFGVCEDAATLRLTLCGDAEYQEELELVFDAALEIIEDPMLLVL